METIQVEKTTKPSISFNETIEITQESTGPVVLGIDPTPAGTKWKVSRIAVQRGTSPTVQYMGAYDLDSPLDIAGKQRFAVSEIGYKRAYNLTSAEDILVFYPVGNEDIVAYPTNSVEVLSSPEEFTAFIEDVEEETVPIVPGPIQPTPKPVPPIQTGPSSYMGYYYEIADLSNFMGQNRGWAYTLYPPEASNGEYFNYSSVLALQDSFSTSNSAESAVKSYINSLQEAERFQKIANNQATNTTSQLPQAVQNILNSLPTQNASANNNNTGDGLPSTIASMNTDGDGYITWRNGLSNNEIAAKEAAVAEAVAAAEAYAASQEGKAATAAEHERIMREIAAGGVPRL